MAPLFPLNTAAPIDVPPRAALACPEMEIVAVALLFLILLISPVPDMLILPETPTPPATTRAPVVDEDETALDLINTLPAPPNDKVFVNIPVT